MNGICKIGANVGNMKSWFVPTIQITANADSQFFIKRGVKPTDAHRLGGM